MMNHYTTSTTPTLTPTTLRIIEDSFGMAAGDINGTGSFVPPLPSSSQVHLNTWNGGRILNNNDQDEDMDEIKETKPEVQQPKKRGGRRATGGRRPNAISNLSPEEDQRRKLRRERNKQAAARCRKRRVDHTNSLQDETDRLEDVKRSIQTQIKNLQVEKEEMELILEAHGHCNKPNVMRPTSLDLKTPSTPSNGLIDIDWNLPTGLTPTGFTPLMTPGTTGAIISGLGLIKAEACEDDEGSNMRLL